MNDKIKLDSIEDAIADFKEGKFLIVVDDEIVRMRRLHYRRRENHA